MPRTIAYRAGGFTNCGIGYTKFSQEELAEMKDRTMTESEAIECLKCYRAQSGTSFPEEIEMAINALEEIEQYRAIGTPEECRAAVEMQTAKKLNIERNIDRYEHFCQNCGAIVTIGTWDISRYCPECGQKLDWSDEA